MILRRLLRWALRAFMVLGEEWDKASVDRALAHSVHEVEAAVRAEQAIFVKGLKALDSAYQEAAKALATTPGAKPQILTMLREHLEWLPQSIDGAARNRRAA